MRLAALIAALFLVGCVSTDVRVEEWRIEYHEDAAGVRDAARDSVTLALMGQGFEYAESRSAAVLQTLFVQGFADSRNHVLHVMEPRGENDQYRFCLMGHELYHATHGAFHGERMAGCVEPKDDES